MGEMLADFPVWLYIVFGVIYLISRLWKKPAEQNDFPEYGPENPAPKPGKDQSGRVDTPAPQQMTFEELLREITEGKSGSKPVPKAVPEVVYESYEEEIEEEEEEEVVDKTDYRHERRNEAYENAKAQAFMRPSLEETMSLKDTDLSFGRFKEFERETQPDLIQRYLIDFKDPDGLKRAVIMSEILKRKF